MDNTPRTNYSAPQRRRRRLGQDSRGPFSSAVLTLMDKRATPSCLRIRTLCRHPAPPPPPQPPRSTGRRGNNCFHGCCGVSFAKVPVSLPPTLPAAAAGVLGGGWGPGGPGGGHRGEGYYLRLLPAQCTLWDNVLIGRDPHTAEVMLSLLREEEGGEGGRRHQTHLGKEKSEIQLLFHWMHHNVCSKIENYGEGSVMMMS